MSYNTENFTEQGGAVSVIGGELRIASGGSITADGVQAAAVSTTSGQSLGFVSASVDSLIIALRGVGIIAT